MAATQDHLGPNDLKTYGKELSTLLMTLVNECGVRVRILDGASMLLYPPDGVSRPFKISSSRPEKNTLGYLKTKFILQYDIHLPRKKDPAAKAAAPKPTPPKTTPSSVTEPAEKKEPAKVGEPTTVFSSTQTPPVSPPRPTAPPSAPHTAPAAKTEEPSKAGAPKAPQSEKNPWLGDVSYEDVLAKIETLTLPDGWEQYASRGNRTIMMTNDGGKTLQCIVCWERGDEVILDSGRQTGGHFVANHSGGKMWTRAARAKGTDTLRENRKREVVEASINALMEAFEIEPQVVEVKTSDTAEVERLKKALTKAEQERDAALAAKDEAEARLALVRETLTV